jgi:GAF domain-containing protein
MVIESPARRGLVLIDSKGKSADLLAASLKDLAGFLGRTSRKEDSAIKYQFREARQEEAFLLEYRFNIVLATYITFASSHCLLFVGDDASWSELGRADLEILERLGHHSAISLGKAAAQEQVNKARDGAYLVAEAMALGDTDVVLEKAVEGIRKSVDCDTATLYVLDQRTGNFIFPPELAGVDDKLAAQKLLWEDKESVMKRITGIHEYHPADDTRIDPLMDGAFVRREGIVSSAAIPIVSQNEKIGVLFVNYRRPHHFDEADEKNLKFLAHQIAVAIRNLQQFNTMKRQETSLNALYQTERLIASFTDLTDTLGQIAKQVWDVANSNNRKTNVISINLIENNQARVVAAYPAHELRHITEVLKGKVDLVSAEKIGLVGVAFNERLSVPGAERTRVFRDLKNNPAYIALHNNTQSELVALIEDETLTILGAIAVENSDENAFDQRDRDVIETLASQAGEAICKDRQARALHDSTRQNARLQAVSLTGLSLSISRHEIHNLCLLISESAEACLQNSHGGFRRDSHRSELETIRKSAKQLLEKPSTAPLDFAHGRLHERVNKLIHQHITKLRQDRRIRVDFKYELEETAETTVWINKDWFNKALGLFTRNSLRAIGESRSGVLTVRTRIIENNRCHIEIDDTGPGMELDVWEKLFEDPVVNHGSNGQGVGLLVARTIVEFYGGAVHKIANAKHDGITTLGFSLPISSRIG